MGAWGRAVRGGVGCVEEGGGARGGARGDAGRCGGGGAGKREGLRRAWGGVASGEQPAKAGRRAVPGPSEHACGHLGEDGDSGL